MGSQVFFAPGQTFLPHLGGLPVFAGSLSTVKPSCEMTGTSCFPSHPRPRHTTSPWVSALWFNEREPRGSWGHRSPCSDEDEKNRLISLPVSEFSSTFLCLLPHPFPWLLLPGSISAPHSCSSVSQPPSCKAIGMFRELQLQEILISIDLSTHLPPGLQRNSQHSFSPTEKGCDLDYSMKPPSQYLVPPEQ